MSLTDPRIARYRRAQKILDELGQFTIITMEDIPDPKKKKTI